jgi:hypothetical protein
MLPMTIKANRIGIRTPINSFGNRPSPLVFLTTGTLLSDLFVYGPELTGIETPFLLLHPPCVLKIELDGTLALQKLRKSLTGEKRFRSMFIGDDGELLPKVR